MLLKIGVDEKPVLSIAGGNPSPSATLKVEKIQIYGIFQV